MASHGGGHYQRGGRGGGRGEDREGLSAVDRSQRSVFVGNISYEATEEQIKEVFSAVGPVVHFRLVHDRDTGKPKGYGFCEFVDQQTAESAIRNLNGFEFHGRPLRVDSAAGSERNVEEIRQLQMTLGGPQEESPYGTAPPEGKAPEAISRAVASLPPEQMFELMKQMKLCVQNNANEARNMLLQNPQLAYALLQAQVVMRIVDPQVALTMLHRETVPPAAPLLPQGQMAAPLQTPFHQQQPMGQPMMQMPAQMRPGGPAPMPPGYAGPSPMGAAAGGSYRPTQQPPIMQPSRAPTSSEDQEKAALLMQVLAMTDEQIQMLEPEERHQVLTLRNSLRGQ